MPLKNVNKWKRMGQVRCQDTLEVEKTTWKDGQCNVTNSHTNNSHLAGMPTGKRRGRPCLLGMDTRRQKIEKRLTENSQSQRRSTRIFARRSKPVGAVEIKEEPDDEHEYQLQSQRRSTRIFARRSKSVGAVEIKEEPDDEHEYQLSSCSQPYTTRAMVAEDNKKKRGRSTLSVPDKEKTRRKKAEEKRSQDTHVKHLDEPKTSKNRRAVSEKPCNEREEKNAYCRDDDVESEPDNHIEDSDEELFLDDNKLKEVERKVETVFSDVNKELKKAKHNMEKEFIATLQKNFVYPRPMQRVYNNKPPVELMPELWKEDNCIGNVDNELDDPDQGPVLVEHCGVGGRTRYREPAAVITPPGIIEPMMRWFNHVEGIVKSNPSERLTNIPYTGSADRENHIAERLKKKWGASKLPTEGLDYVSDYHMFCILKQLLTECEEKGMANELHKTLKDNFPHKVSLQKLKSPTGTDYRLALEIRFSNDPYAIRMKQIKNQADSSFAALYSSYCCLCGEFECPRHRGDAPIKWTPPTETTIYLGVGFDKRPKPSKPCGNDCFMLPLSPRKQKSVDATPFSSPTLITHLNDMLLLDEDRTMCDMHEEMALMCASMETELRERIRSCRELYHMVQQHGVKGQSADVPPPTKKMRTPAELKQRQMAFRGHIRRYIGDEPTIKRMHGPCEHEGPCHLAASGCHCLDNKLVCTKYCNCDEKCMIKFNGCSCTPGHCNSKQCACVIGGFECDPELCIVCNCDVTDVKDVPLCKNIGIQNNYKKAMIVGPSLLDGLGCYAEHDIEKGELIAEYTGELIDHTETERRGVIYDSIQSSYVFDLDLFNAIDAFRFGNIIRFANSGSTTKHGNMNNAQPKNKIVAGENRIGIYALRNIQRGEEILFDYHYSTRQKKNHFVEKKKEKSSAGIKLSNTQAKTKKKRAMVE